jgi:hypothetical protein
MKYDRVPQTPQFSEEETDKLTVFGTGTDVTNPGIPTSNVSDIMGDNSQWKQGWMFQKPVQGDVPLQEDFNNINYVFNYLINYLFQVGIPEWSAEQEYYTNNFCNYNGVIYISLQGITGTPNLNKNPASEATYWRIAFPTLDNEGKIPASFLPSYVDEILEYDNLAAFPTTGESGKIYVALDTNKTYRWGGTEYTIISESLALGETSSTAFPGDRGKALETALGSSPDHVIESFIDEEGNWYKKYSSGLLEQGGLVTYPYTTSGRASIFTLNQPFANGNYSVFVHKNANSGDDTWNILQVTNKTTTSFQANTQYCTTVGWLAIGLGEQNG